ncbi:MAG: proline--tRNA ligase, partial [Alphaproteobacteria bacterium]|nr:proline--tRNA ligase [Alphaproteobacteria bacterium]
VLCIPVIVGEKTAGERFPGAVDTWSIEGMMQDGKALQAGTSHFLGQNFSRAYNIKYDKLQSEEFVWTTSWGISTRLIGGLIMTHSDDNGLVLPPAIAPVHLRVLLLTEDQTEAKRLRGFIEESWLSTNGAPIVCGEPLRIEYLEVGRRPGDSFWEAVKQGVPAIAQVGRREMKSGSISLTLRTDAQLQPQSIDRDRFRENLVESLESMQADLLVKARAFRDSNLIRPSSLAELTNAFSASGVSPFALCPMDVAAESEDAVQSVLKEHKLSIRCLPEGDLGILAADAKCLFTGTTASHIALIGKSY